MADDLLTRLLFSVAVPVVVSVTSAYVTCVIQFRLQQKLREQAQATKFPTYEQARLLVTALPGMVHPTDPLPTLALSRKGIRYPNSHEIMGREYRKAVGELVAQKLATKESSTLVT